MSFRCKCPKCGHLIIECEIPGCNEIAKHEGWMADVGVLSGIEIKVCDEHKELLRGGSNGQEESETTP